MAATNIDNLDDLLDGVTVAELTADEGAVLQKVVVGAFSNASPDAHKLVGLFKGQMSAEAFDLAAGDGTGVKAYVQSPTVKIEWVIRDADRPLILAYLLDEDDEWERFSKGPLPLFL